MTGSLFTYLEWRGDLTFDATPFCEVDNLILTVLVYLDFKNIVPSEPGSFISLHDAAERYFDIHGPADLSSIDEVASTEARACLLQYLADSVRFSTLLLSDYVDVLDVGRSEQFAAMTIHFSPDALYTAFRGTSDDLAGWKEDFLLACLPEVPSQGDAVAYLTRIAVQYPRASLIVGGHSKGGNLAVYSAAFCPPDVQSRILSVWSNDGPGFDAALLQESAFLRIEPRIHSIVPKSSVVGMLMTHLESYTVVESTSIGLLQHDALTWVVHGSHFVTLPSLTSRSIQTDHEIKAWIQSIPEEDRETFVNALFDVLSASGAQTVSEYRSDGLSAMLVSLHSMRGLPKAIQDQIIRFVFLLSRISYRLKAESRRLEAGRRLRQAPALASLLERQQERAGREDAPAPDEERSASQSEEPDDSSMSS